MPRVTRLALAALLVQPLAACGGATPAPATAAAARATPTSPNPAADHGDTRRFLAALAAGKVDHPEDPLLVGLGVWRDWCAADSNLCNRGTRVDALLTGPDGDPQLDAQGEPKTVEISRIIADEERVALAASAAVRQFAQRIAAGKFREATQAERQIVLDSTPSEVPTDVTIDVLEATPSAVAFASWDGHVFWLDTLTAH